MKDATRIHIPLRNAAVMIGRYVRSRLAEQARAVAFIILYLWGFQILVLGDTPTQALRLTAGLAMVVVGLALFLEGILLGLMPLGERVGVQLPRRRGLMVTMAFGLLLGFSSTLAEPAIAALRVIGDSVTAWDAPLLYMVLQRRPDLLVLAIGIGVALAVAVGMFRFSRGLSIKPFIYTAIPALLALSTYCAMDPRLEALLGLAWDAGAITTGAVTVPLVLALGIGVSRAAGRHHEAGSGFGVIMLASAYPVAGVLLLGMLLAPGVSKPVDEASFFSPGNRPAALALMGSEAALRQHAFRHAGAPSRRSCYPDEGAYLKAVTSLATSTNRRHLLASMPLPEWINQYASREERELLHSPLNNAPVALENDAGDPISTIFRSQCIGALRTIVPLTLLLLGVLVLLRDRPRHHDEVILGIGMSLIGMAVLTSGIQIGLVTLGNQVGRPLPRLFRSIDKVEGQILIEPFHPESVYTRHTAEGRCEQFFFLDTPRGGTEAVAFDPAQYDAVNHRYEHVVKRPPLFGPRLTLAGIGLVFLFAFGLGYGATLAEPALAALGRSVETISAGTIRSRGVIHAVAAGVGTGVVVGVIRILYDIPILWLLVPPYLLLLPLTWISEEDFAAIAWDSGGVTTGPVTVPLVLAMGFGIGSAVDVSDGFGLLAMASAYPVLSVLLYGMVIRSRQRRVFRAISQEAAGE
ncbi:MAG TPA: DUF1538 domain-containing protein [Verrucomicrobia bacterium]|nr:DUF1538 domain-containing protein [Verrucomicrobiota bacterium]